MSWRRVAPGLTVRRSESERTTAWRRARSDEVVVVVILDVDGSVEGAVGVGWKAAVVCMKTTMKGVNAG